VNRQDAEHAKLAKVLIEPSARLDGLAHAVIGAAIEVHRLLGPGFSETVYEEALAWELESRDIPFARQVQFVVDYKGRRVGRGRIDLLVDKELVVELKSVEQIALVHQSQVVSYLKATGKHLGLLINFNVALLKRGIHRIVASP
jgi:GxxExxY protein